MLKRTERPTSTRPSVDEKLLRKGKVDPRNCFEIRVTVIAKSNGVGTRGSGGLLPPPPPSNTRGEAGYA